jgi:hypothetical protein
LLFRGLPLLRGDGLEAIPLSPRENTMVSTRTMRFVVGLSVFAVAATANAQTQVTNRSQVSNPFHLSWGTTSPSSNPFTHSLGFTDITASNNGSSGPWYSCAAGPSCWQGGFTDGQNILFQFGLTNMSFTFSSLITGFATQAWYNFGPGGGVTVTTWRGGNQTASFGYTTGGGNAPNADQATTLGVVDGAGFDRLDLDFTGEAAINDVDISETQAVVPEPGTVVLFGTGLVGLVGFVSRRRRSA